MFYYRAISVCILVGEGNIEQARPDDSVGRGTRNNEFRMFNVQRSIPNAQLGDVDNVTTSKENE